MRLNIVTKTDVGRKREHNEDAFLVDEELGLIAVADGMGGHAAGDVASQEAVASLHDHVLAGAAIIKAFQQNHDPGNAENLRRMLENAIRAAAYQVFGVSEMDKARKGMGTTLSLLLVQPEAAFLAHVGDSRIYMLREGQLRQVTSDHTYVAEMVRRGKMTEQEASSSRMSNLLIRAVGSHDYVEVDTRILRYKRHDVFLLCSDGLTGHISDAEFPRLIQASDLHWSAERLVNTALERGGKDNITLVLARVDET